MTASQKQNISILLVDDHPVVRQGYRRVLEHQTDFRVVAEALDNLGEREIEILRQIAAGSTKEQIAANLNLSVKTVQNYHYLVKTKTGMQTDAQLV